MRWIRQLLRPVFQQTSEYLIKEKVLEKFRSVGNTLLVALDGTGYFSSESIHCEQCSVAHHKDGRTDKQDCEQRAARRWLAQVAPRYGELDITLLGDALYATHPLIQEVVDAEMGYLFTAKENSHRYLYEEIASLEKLGEVHVLQRKRWTGRKASDLELPMGKRSTASKSDDSINVNWVELIISDEDSKRTFHTAFIGSHLVSE